MKKKTPLHLAIEEKNNKAVKILLQYMATINYNQSVTFKDVLKDLIEVSDFLLYMQELPFTTLQMQQKQTLKV